MAKGQSKRRSRLAREIVVVLVIKFVMLAVIWWVWFSEPADKGLSSEHIGTVIYSATGATQEKAHASRP